MIQVFKERNRNNFSSELLNSISMKELFKGSMNNNFLNANDARIETMPPFSRISPLTNQMIHSQIYKPNINKIGNTIPISRTKAPPKKIPPNKTFHASCFLIKSIVLSFQPKAISFNSERVFFINIILPQYINKKAIYNILYKILNFLKIAIS